MNAWLKQPARLLTAVLAGLCALLLVVLGLQRLLAGAGGGADVVTVSAAQGPGTSELETRQFELPPKSDYAEIAARPLFYEDRRPETHEGGSGGEGDMAEQVAQTELPPVTLTGVIITPDKRVAMLENNKDKQKMAVKEGESVEGWTLKSVSDRSIVFSSGDSEQSLELEVYTGPAGAGRRPPRNDNAQPAASSQQDNKDQPVDAAQLIRQRIERERERRRQLIEQARKNQQGGG